jgi:phosphohistidine phosphatase SixA
MGIAAVRWTLPPLASAARHKHVNAAGHVAGVTCGTAAPGRRIPREGARMRATLSLLALLAGLLGSGALAQRPTPFLAGAELAPALRGGGLALYVRRPATESHQADAEEIDFANCGTQRNLSDAGRRTARDAGAALRDMGVTVGRIVTSEYCRAREAAVLMGLSGAEADAALNDGGRMLAKGPASPQAEALRTMLRTAPEPGRVTLIVAHRPNIADAAGRAFADIAEAEIIAFQPMAVAPGFQAVGRIRPADWPALPQAGRGG